MNVESATNPYDCCVECFTTNKDSCQFSFWYSFGVCENYLGNTCDNPGYNAGSFTRSVGSRTGGVVSNGPCGYLKEGPISF